MTKIDELNEADILEQEKLQQEEDLEKNCSNKHNHEKIRFSGSDDGCPECGFYSK